MIVGLCVGSPVEVKNYNKSAQTLAEINEIKKIINFWKFTIIIVAT